MARARRGWKTGARSSSVRRRDRSGFGGAPDQHLPARRRNQLQLSYSLPKYEINLSDRQVREVLPRGGAFPSHQEGMRGGRRPGPPTREGKSAPCALSDRDQDATALAAERLGRKWDRHGDRAPSHRRNTVTIEYRRASSDAEWLRRHHREERPQGPESRRVRAVARGHGSTRRGPRDRALTTSATTALVQRGVVRPSEKPAHRRRTSPTFCQSKRRTVAFVGGGGSGTELTSRRRRAPLNSERRPKEYLVGSRDDRNVRCPTSVDERAIMLNLILRRDGLSARFALPPCAA
jgi:hypothetical protein